MTLPNYRTHKRFTKEYDPDTFEGSIDDVVAKLEALRAEYPDAALVQLSFAHDRWYQESCELRYYVVWWVPFTKEELAEAKERAKVDAAKRAAAKKKKQAAAAKGQATKEAKKKAEIAAYIKAHPELLEELKD